MKGQARTVEATLAVLARSRSNEEKLEQNLSLHKKITTTELAKKLRWTTNKTNSTLYRLIDKDVVRFEYFTDKKKGKTVKELYLTSNKNFLR